MMVSVSCSAQMHWGGMAQKRDYFNGEYEMELTNILGKIVSNIRVSGLPGTSDAS